ncbi:MAG: lipopolysaccharide biosynthesis protein [Chloroflexales bacterium]
MIALRQAAVSGIKWSTASLIGRQILLLGTLVLLSRIVGPQSYGLISMAVTITGFIDLLKDLGTGAAIIQRKECDDALLSSTFWLNLAIGALSTALVALGAPLAARYFREPGVTSVLRLLSLSFVVSSLGLVPLVLTQRAIAFRTLGMIELGAAAVGAAVGVGMGLAGFGVWSLVGQTLAATTTTTALAWAVSPWRPRLRFERSAIELIRAYGSGLVGFNIVNYFIRNADYALIGRYLGALSLGFYTLAYRIMLFPQQNVSLVVNRVMFAVLARIDDDAQFRRAYLQLTTAIAFLATPTFIVLGALREPLVRAVFGPAWLPAADLLLVLAPVGLSQSLSGTVGLIYQARARTDWMFRWGLGSGVITVSGFVIGLRWGSFGVACAYAIAALILVYPVFAIPFRLIGLPMTTFVRGILPALACGLGMLLTILLLAPLAASMPDIASLAALGAVGGMVYLGLSWWLNRAIVRDVVRMLFGRRP